MEQTDISSDIAIQRRKVNIVVIRYRNNIVHETFLTTLITISVIGQPLKYEKISKTNFIVYY